MVVFHKLCRIAHSLQVHKTESLSAMSHTLSIKIKCCSTVLY